MVNHRRKKRLTIAGFVIVIVTFIFGRVLTDELKDSVDSLTTAENVYRQEIGTSTTATQLANLQMQANATSQKLLLQENKYKDYSLVVTQDLATLQQVKSELNLDMDDVSRLLDQLPPGAKDLRATKQTVKAQVDSVNQSVADVSKPTPVNDLSRAVKVKLSILPLVIAEVQVFVFGDAVLTREKAVREAREKLYGFCKLAGYTFYALGIGLALYAQLAGYGSISAPE